MDVSKVYVVVWGGGQDVPSYKAFLEKDQAEITARQWAEEIDEEEGDYVDLLEVKIKPEPTMERVYIK